MKLMVDAQLPRRLADGNATPDDALREVADREGRVLVTKDADFVDSFLLRGEPVRLLLVSTGNIPNRELEALFPAHLGAVVAALTANASVEIDRAGLTIRG